MARRHEFPFGLLTAALALAAIAGPARAQYDTPAMRLLSVDRSSATLEVEAGPSGAPAGFRIDWIAEADYAALGGWPANPYHAAIQRCDFLGTPTLTPTDGVASYLLPPGAVVRIEIGDLFDETGAFATYPGELQAGAGYYLRVQALAPGSVDPGSPWSGDLYLRTLGETTTDCTYTQGYWKNHPGAWPVSSLTIGGVSYSQAELLDIFDTPAAGNGAIFLAHQLIAALLNIANGASAGSIQAAVDAADALFAGCGSAIPPVGSCYIAPASASDLTEELDNFNNGLLGPPHCDTVQSEASTWGRMKSQYR
jgi:hypothetical protein